MQVDTLQVTVPPTVATPLLSSIPSAFRARVTDVLLTALVLAITEWRREQGRGVGTAVLIELEGHGREEIFPDVDLSRTVGWFTSLFPVRLDCAGVSASRALKLVKEQLRRSPDNGVSYGLLRYLNTATAQVLRALPTPPISFNYLGRFSAAPDADWVIAPEMDFAAGARTDSHLPLAHGLEVNAVTLDHPTGPQLVATWMWSAALLSRNEARELAEMWLESLRALTEQLSQPGVAGLTPSDVPLVKLTQAQIEALEMRYDHNVHDILPLSPLQEGLFFHSVYSEQSSDLYAVQTRLTLEGRLEERTLQDRARGILRRYSNLRAAFLAGGLGPPCASDREGNSATLEERRSQPRAGGGARSALGRVGQR